ncbi:hypothetical protein C3E98_028430 [Pseudomonas sp. MWU13-2625]|nr:hypothetical protein C3E97_027595 [Pseudomonas sp. MWU12-2115]RBL68061.1 hypothetical protein C3E98_028430 [Pseudomonas sp. MWU13-2625]
MVVSFGCGNRRNHAERIYEIRDYNRLPRNDKALNNQGFVVSNMPEAMGFELMDLLQSTVKTAMKSR